MKVNHPTKRYKVTFGVDTHLSKGKIGKILTEFDCFNIEIEAAE